MKNADPNKKRGFVLMASGGVFFFLGIILVIRQIMNSTLAGGIVTLFALGAIIGGWGWYEWRKSKKNQSPPSVWR